MAKPQTVFREPFPQFVQDQIDVRERIQGKGLIVKAVGTKEEGVIVTVDPRTMDDLNYLNGRTAWIRLMSGVDVLNISEQLNTRATSKKKNDKLHDAIIESMKILSTDYSDILQPFGVVGGGRGKQTLAYNYILSNGVESYEPRSTINLDNYADDKDANVPHYGDNSAYGLGIRAQGFKPMPGIVSADIRDFNNGALREATIKIKAYDLEQLQIIEILYMRLGFSMFLEWGHTIYPTGKAEKKNDKYEIKKVGPDNDPSLRSVIFPPKGKKQLSYNKILEKIQKQRETYQGNYDGFLGRITNFTWTYDQSGESYDIELKMLSVGSVIESLNMNTGFDIPAKHREEFAGEQGTPADPSESDDPPGEAKELTLEQRYFRESLKTNLSHFLWLGRQHTNELAAVNGYRGVYPYNQAGKKTSSNTTGGEVNVTTGWGYDIPLNEVKGESFDPWALSTGSAVSSKNPSYNPKTFITIPHQYEQRGYVGSAWENAPVDEWITYIRLGDLLQWIEKHNNESTTGFDEEGNAIEDPIVNIHYDYDSVVNKMYHFTPYIFSADPSICVVKNAFGIKADKRYTPNVNDEEAIFANYYYYPQCEKFRLGTDETTLMQLNYGCTMNIYLNVAYLMNCANSSINEYEQGMVSVIDFLTKVCNGINESLGHVCHLFPWMDNDTKTLYLMNEFDNNEDLEPLEPASLLRTSGYIGDADSDRMVAGTVKNLKITTGLSKNIQNTIAIGAAAQGVSLGQESVSFLSWHNGLEDRIFKQLAQSRKGGNNQEQRINKEGARITALIDGMSQTAYALATLSQTTTYASRHVEKQYPIFDNTLFDSAKTVLKDYIHITSGYVAKEQKATTPYNGFLPLNYTLTLDGISGIKIFQRFRLQSRALPTRYDTVFDTIVKNITHTISNNEWNTQIETFVIYNNRMQTNNYKSSLKNPFYVEIGQYTQPSQSDPNKPETKSVRIRLNLHEPRLSVFQDVIIPAEPTAPTGTADYDLTPTWNNPIKRKIIEELGWPVTFKLENGKYYGKVVGRANNRVTLEVNPNYQAKIKTIKVGALKVSVHQAFAPLAQTMLQALVDAGYDKLPYIDPILGLGSFVPRTIANNPGQLSAHSWAIGLDINGESDRKKPQPIFKGFLQTHESYNRYKKAVAAGDLGTLPRADTSDGADYYRAKPITLIKERFVDTTIAGASNKVQWGGYFSNTTPDVMHFIWKYLI